MAPVAASDWRLTRGAPFYPLSTPQKFHIVPPSLFNSCPSTALTQNITSENPSHPKYQRYTSSHSVSLALLKSCSPTELGPSQQSCTIWRIWRKYPCKKSLGWSCWWKSHFFENNYHNWFSKYIPFICANYAHFLSDPCAHGVRSLGSNVCLSVQELFETLWRPSEDCQCCQCCEDLANED